MKRHSLMITAATLAAATVLGAGCAKKPEAKISETAISQVSAEEITKTPETTVKAPETTEQAAEIKEVYYMLQGIVTKVTKDGAAFILQADDGRDYDISQSDTRDVEVKTDENVQIAIIYIGEPLGGPENMALVVTLSEQEEWSVLTERDTITANAMSSFTMKTDDGQELSFLEDSCSIEEGALAEDSGGKVTVICVNSQGVSCPVEIKGTK